MSIQEIDIFIAVAQKRNFASVAQERNVAPSSISRAVASLEDRLHIRLFHRTTRKVSLTEAGEAYFNKIVPILDDLKQAAENAHDVQQKPAGNIRMTSSVTFGNKILLPAVHAFMEQYPDITLDYILSDQVVDLVSERIDVAIRHGELDDSSFIGTKLLKTSYRVVASPHYLKKHGRPRHPSDLLDHSCLIFDWPTFRNKWKFKIRNRKLLEVPITGRYCLTNGTALRALALEGAGIALLVNWLIDDDLREGRLVNLFPDYQVSAHNFDTAIWLVTPSRPYMPLRVRLLIDFLKKSLR
ncbi:MAG: LysR family transcriptional regulator [Alphaproteobacteria bacterium]|nr:LysR family transcriptional regulator [Alphaproteobacteria bacterium]QQS58258.1 MAG: LysR family transcriptional regulator [Alphaproteobacteria bacterium]